jgi:heme O synthase-like polyprenyltransferase
MDETGDRNHRQFRMTVYDMRNMATKTDINTCSFPINGEARGREQMSEACHLTFTAVVLMLALIVATINAVAGNWLNFAASIAVEIFLIVVAWLAFRERHTQLTTRDR